MKELTKQIKEKSFYKVYLLTGDAAVSCPSGKTYAEKCDDKRRRYDELCRFYRR